MSKRTPHTVLPVDAICEELLEKLAGCGRVVLTAPTGSGKSTRVPPAVLSMLKNGSQVVVLQPRRIACRLLALRVASEMGEEVGKTVGFETRSERCVGRDTRIRFVTEGLFLRQLQANPELPGVGAVILDEFHERHVAGDVSLGLCRRLNASRREPFCFVVMSATLDAASLGTWLDAPVLETRGSLHPVETRYHPETSTAEPWRGAASIASGMSKGGLHGHILIFMPGVREIRRTVEWLRRTPLLEGIPVVPLYGELPANEQDAATKRGGPWRIIVATNVAETSITIDGVTAVIDSGRVKLVTHDPNRGINMLVEVSNSQASADQRRGRAGRTGPGVCHRMWSEQEQRTRREFDPPEVLRVDLADTLLFLKSMGMEASTFPWVTDPPEEAVLRGSRLLEELGAVDSAGVTSLGSAMAAVPLHPRLSRLLCEASLRGVLADGALLCAALSEPGGIPRRESFGMAPPGSDVDDLLERHRQCQQRQFAPAECQRNGLTVLGARRVAFLQQRLQRLALPLLDKLGSSKGGEPSLTACVLAGWPDRLGGRVHGGRSFEFPEGVTAVADESSAAFGSEAVVALELREVVHRGGRRRVISLGEPVTVEEVSAVFPSTLSRERVRLWNRELKRVEWFDELSYRGVSLHRKAVPRGEWGDGAPLLVERVLSGELPLEHWGEEVAAWLERAAFVAEHFPERRLPDFSQEDIEVALLEICDGAHSYNQIRKRPCLPVLQNMLSWEDQELVRRMAPERIKLPSGYGMRIVYKGGEAPRGRARIQDFYDLAETPKVAGGRVPVLLEILAPNMRAVQTTDDLQGFWERTYPEIRNQLARRYPKHQWR